MVRSVGMSVLTKTCFVEIILAQYSKTYILL